MRVGKRLRTFCAKKSSCQFGCEKKLFEDSGKARSDECNGNSGSEETVVERVRSYGADILYAHPTVDL